HPNIVTALKAFTTNSGFYIVLEHMPLFFEPIVRSPAYPDARQLAQIITGVTYLVVKGFEYGSFTCSNILLNTDGDVKIGRQDVLI
ncbi:hypothetical protein DL98DRAFT_435014, partial [Cadophora sp. DSE1049]